MTASVLSFAEARARREQRRQADLDDVLSLRFDGTVVVDERGELDPEYASWWQAKADAMGLPATVQGLTPDQLMALAKVMGTWAFLARRRIGRERGPNEHDPKSDYLWAVANGTPKSAPLPEQLRAEWAAAFEPAPVSNAQG